MPCLRLRAFCSGGTVLNPTAIAAGSVAMRVKHAPTLMFIFVQLGISCAMEMETIKTSLVAPKTICGVSHDQACESGDADCLLNFFKNDISTGFKLFGGKSPSEYHIKSSMRSVHFMPCAKPVLPDPWERLCGIETKYFATLTDRRGDNILKCAKAYAPFYSDASNALSGACPAYSSSLHSPAGTYDSLDLGNYTWELKQLKDLCFCARGDYIAIIGVCDAVSSAFIIHIVCMVLAFGLSIPVAHVVKDKNPFAYRVAIACGFTFILASILSGAFAPELTKPLHYNLFRVLLIVAFFVDVVRVKLSFWFTSTLQGLRSCPAYDRFVSLYLGLLNRVQFFCVFILAPYSLLAAVVIALKICTPDRMSTIGIPGNMCLGHFSVGFGLNFYGIFVMLYGLKAVTLNHELAWLENRLLFAGSSALLFITLFVASDASEYWPFVGYTVADNQHIGLYLLLFVSSGLSMLAVYAKVRPATFIGPVIFGVMMTSALLYLHDPNSTGVYRQLHVASAASLFAFAIARLTERYAFAGYTACLGGFLFTSTMGAHLLRNTLSHVDYLAYFFYSCCWCALLCAYVISVWALTQKLSNSDVKLDTASDLKQSEQGGYSAVELSAIDDDGEEMVKEDDATHAPSLGV